MITAIKEKMKGFDKLDLNYGLVLDLPFNEGFGGNGTLTRDISPAHHEITMTIAPTWTQWPLSNITYLQYNGAQYLEGAAANTADLDFTTGDYSFASWVYIFNSAVAQILMGRYALDTDGWEIYFEDQLIHGYLQLRHHHASLAPNVRDGCYSEGWFSGWCLMGMSRRDAYPTHFRNGRPLEMTYEAGGLADPDSANRDLVIGVRFTKNANYSTSGMKHLRAWDRYLEEEDHRAIFETERFKYGV